MIKRIGAMFSVLALFGTMQLFVGCATPPPRGSESPELGELRGGGGEAHGEKV